jgi:hypothetical protein
MCVARRAGQPLRHAASMRHGLRQAWENPQGLSHVRAQLLSPWHSPGNCPAHRATLPRADVSRMPNGAGRWLGPLPGEVCAAESAVPGAERAPQGARFKN